MVRESRTGWHASGRRGRVGEVAALTVLALACRGTQLPETTPAATPRPLPSAVVPSSSAGASPVATTARATVELHLVVPGKRLRLNHLTNGLFVLSDRAIVALRGDEAVVDPALMAGTKPCNGSYELMAGSFPDDAWLSQGVRISHFENGAWRVRQRLAAQRTYLVPETSGRLLVGFVPEDPEQPTHYAFTRVPAVSGLAPPQPSTDPTRDPSCKTRPVIPTAIDRASDGTLFVFGNGCLGGVPGSGVALVDIWRPGAEVPRTTELADADSAIMLAQGAALVRAPNDAWVGGGGYLAHFDGSHWLRVPTPKVPGGVTSLSQPTSTGRLWATVGNAREGALAIRDASDAWSLVPVPAAAGVPRKVVALADDDIWLEAEHGIFHSRPAKNAFTEQLACEIVIDEDARNRMRAP
jgi:hypothetical protein